MTKMIRAAAMFLLILFTCFFIHADLIEFYKKGTIKLIPEPNFGIDVDWEALFYDKYKDLVVTPDGTIFVSNDRLHNVFKFSDKGNFIGKFGQKGNGPSDLYNPSDLSILDGKYVLVGEYPSGRRFSLFDLTGKYVKVIKTDNSPFSPIALKNSKLAYLNYKYPGYKKNSSQTPTMNRTNVVIKDTESGKEAIIDSIEIPDKSWIRLEGYRGVIRLENYIGQVMLAQTKDGNLVVGASNSPVMKIYSENGILLRTFRLKMAPVPVTSDYIAKFKAYKVASNLALTGKDASVGRYTAKLMKKFPFEHFFEEHLPYYRKLIVDSEGNILVFKWTDCIGECTKIFQVYSPDGTFVCETKIDQGIFDFEIDRRWNNIVFTDKGIFGLFYLKDDEEETLRLVKVNVQ